MEKISVIVPIYNGEKFLQKCLSSLVSQTYPNLEILLINDCSTDNSGLICKEYCAKHENIAYFESTENRGVSHSRNFGIENASGSLVGFVDSDDWIEADMYASLYETLNIHNVPMVSANFRRIRYNTQDEVPEDSIHRKEIHIDNTIDLLMYIIGNMDVVLWNKLYKREVFDGIIFPEGKVYEDIGAIHLLAENAGQMMVSTTCVYNYHLQPESITRNKKVSAAIFEHLYAVVERYEYLSGKYESSELEQLCRKRIFTTLSHVADKLCKTNIKGDNRIYDEYSSAKDTVYENYSYEDCGFSDSDKKVFSSLKRGIEHYKISRDLLRVYTCVVFLKGLCNKKITERSFIMVEYLGNAYAEEEAGFEPFYGGFGPCYPANVRLCPSIFFPFE